MNRNTNNWAVLKLESTSGHPPLVFRAKIDKQTSKTVTYSSSTFGENHATLRSKSSLILIENLSEEQAKMIESVLVDRRAECLRETEQARSRYAECEQRIIARMKNRDLHHG